MKENNEVVTNENVKKSTKPMGFKVCLGLIIAMFVIILVIVGTFLGLSYTVGHMDKAKANSFMTDVALMVMPESIESSDDSNLTFYVEKMKISMLKQIKP